jgi:amino acid adenylation domain-containing protein
MEAHASFTPFTEQDIGRSIVERFHQVVGAHGDRLAIQSEDTLVTFAELDRIATALAHRILSHLGPGPEPVALLFDRGADVVAATLAVLKSGKFYVVLDPQNPRERLRHLLTDSQSKLIVAPGIHLGLARELSDQPAATLEFSGDSVSAFDTTLDIQPAADDLAVLIYTSGSSGRPKGVMHTHRTVLADTSIVTNELRIASDDRFIWHTSVSFGGSTRTIYSAMLNGSALFPFDSKRAGLTQLSDWLIRHEITIFRSVPTTFRTFMATLHDDVVFPAVRILSMGGEPLFRADVENFNRHFLPHCVLVHPFGPTETMMVCWSVTPHGQPAAGHKISIGYPLRDKEVLLLDENGQPVPDGRIGEIAVRSPYLSPGYWRDPDRTRAVFLSDASGGSERTYLTGDLGMRSKDGSLAHAGRRDFQVKIRGYRIEVAEIETAIRDIDGIADAVVVGRQTAAGENRLVAYFVPTSKPVLTVAGIRERLAHKLPDYMMPSIFVAMAALPQTATGKTDRLRLPDVDRTRPEMEAPFTPPSTPIEQTLVGMWTEALAIDRVGIHDDFFELGGDSLMAMRLIAQIKATLAIDLPLQTLLSDRTVAKTAGTIDELRSTGNHAH